jgi:hypothetical protein
MAGDVFPRDRHSLFFSLSLSTSTNVSRWVSDWSSWLRHANPLRYSAVSGVVPVTHTWCRCAYVGCPGRLTALPPINTRNKGSGECWMPEVSR